MTTWVLATMLAIVQPRFLGPSAQGELRLAFSLWDDRGGDHGAGDRFSSRLRSPAATVRGGLA